VIAAPLECAALQPISVAAAANDGDNGGSGSGGVDFLFLMMWVGKVDRVDGGGFGFGFGFNEIGQRTQSSWHRKGRLVGGSGANIGLNLAPPVAWGMRLGRSKWAAGGGGVLLLWLGRVEKRGSGGT
jgi:hypothetical protein